MQSMLILGHRETCSAMDLICAGVNRPLARAKSMELTNGGSISVDIISPKKSANWCPCNRPPSSCIASRSPNSLISIHRGSKCPNDVSDVGTIDLRSLLTLTITGLTLTSTGLMIGRGSGSGERRNGEEELEAVVGSKSMI